MSTTNDTHIRKVFSKTQVINTFVNAIDSDVVDRLPKMIKGEQVPVGDDSEIAEIKQFFPEYPLRVASESIDFNFVYRFPINTNSGKKEVILK